MNRRADLGAFLRSRRARIRPEDAGIRGFGERRRVPGLRREEVAQLAGVSADYYTRFEQGRAGTRPTRSSTPSPGRCAWTRSRPATCTGWCGPAAGRCRRPCSRCVRACAG
ncbi:helix-turn-helix domain-containing protein [Kitasatospora cineracea]|uniref:helix-turn-helix domain-containing protein n=1 Tax=Kitasatospora cineracea TaxID=88074 RepID=UPI003134560B